MYLRIYPSIYLFVCLPIVMYISAYLFVLLFTCLSVCLPVGRSVCVSLSSLYVLLFIYVQYFALPKPEEFGSRLGVLFVLLNDSRLAPSGQNHPSVIPVTLWQQHPLPGLSDTDTKVRTIKLVWIMCLTGFGALFGVNAHVC